MGPVACALAASDAAAAISAAAAAAAAAVSAAARPVGPGSPLVTPDFLPLAAPPPLFFPLGRSSSPSSSSRVSRYGERSSASSGKSTCASIFVLLPPPLHVNRFRCRHRTGGSVCSFVCFVAPPTSAHRSQ